MQTVDLKKYLSMDIKKITVTGGHGKKGSPETFSRFDLQMGDIINIMDLSSCSKMTLVNDIELCEIKSGSVLQRFFFSTFIYICKLNETG
jgi:ABC-type proline/glycine betaine transport system ATPase subunit